MVENPVSIYLHIPFCRHRCGYCDFNTYAGQEDRMEVYTQALCKEIRMTGESAPGVRVHTVFFGGGTPSLLSASQVYAALEAIASAFSLTGDAEISLEANPTDFSEPYLRRLREMGVNRLSLGMQSADRAELLLLERQHDFDAVRRSVLHAREAGFDNLSLDLIFGLPDQPMEKWQRSLESALHLAPEHLSLYALTVEHGTPLSHQIARGELNEPDPDAAAEMYEWASDRMAKAGYEQYEISNWSLRGKYPCRHNLQYWRGCPYLGFGAGAHGYAAGVRTANVLTIDGYIHRLQKAGGHLPFPQTPATQSSNPVARNDEMGETMMMGMRLTQEGVSSAGFQARFGVSLREVYASEIGELTRMGLLEWVGDRLRLTLRGRLLGNQVFYRFLKG